MVLLSNSKILGSTRNLRALLLFEWIIYYHGFSQCHIRRGHPASAAVNHLALAHAAEEEDSDVTNLFRRLPVGSSHIRSCSIC
jgi:hypothetical protein